MKINKIVAALSLASLAIVAQAQHTGDILRMSQNDYSLGTARSAAMGGAFASLGADISSMSINPAGLGMYRTSELSISPSLSFNSDKTVFGLPDRFGSISTTTRDNKTKFGLGSFGIALNVYQGYGTVTSFTVGVGYNKLIDFSNNSSSWGLDQSTAMLDNLAYQIDGESSNLVGQYPAGFDRLSPSQWGGVLGYQTNVLNETTPGNYTPAIGNSTNVNLMNRNSSKGSLGEYSLSGGINIQNMLYLGATIGFTDLYFHNRNTVYEEVASNRESENLMSYNYIRDAKMYGTGINAKFGVVLRPLPALRIGVAIHTPTYTNIEDHYIEGMSSQFKTGSLNRAFDSKSLLYEYVVNTPTRLVSGISWTTKYGVISADHERVWYNKMSVKESGNAGWENGINNDISNSYKPVDNFRFGLEVTPMKGLFLRGGYAFYGNCLRDATLLRVSTADIKSQKSYSGGLGFRFADSSLDITYINTQFEYNQHQVFKDINNDYRTGVISTKRSRNTVTLSYAVRF